MTADAAGTTVEQRVSYYLDRAARVIEQVKRRRGIPLDRTIPPAHGRWNPRHCGIVGCPCPHGRYPDRGDRCDRGFVPTPGDPDGVRETARCSVCRQQAEAARAAKEAS